MKQKLVDMSSRACLGYTFCRPFITSVNFKVWSWPVFCVWSRASASPSVCGEGSLARVGSYKWNTKLASCDGIL